PERCALRAGAGATGWPPLCRRRPTGAGKLAYCWPAVRPGIHGRLAARFTPGAACAAGLEAGARSPAGARGCAGPEVSAPGPGRAAAAGTRHGRKGGPACLPACRGLSTASSSSSWRLRVGGRCSDSRRRDRRLRKGRAREAGAGAMTRAAAA
ncbi:unnamed protein product, partial [Gulo gulo]